MAKKWMAINLALLVAAVLLGRELRRSVQEFDAENDPARIQPVADGKKATAGAPASPEGEPFHSNDYSIIANNTIFSELRGGAEEEVAPAAPAVPPLAQNQRPILVGTLLLDDQYQALMIDPTAPIRGGSRRPETRRVGDIYRGYAITSIAADQMVLENGGRREVIPLHSQNRPAVAGVRPPASATRVVSIGPGGATAGGALAVVAATGTTMRGAPAQNVQPRQGPVRNPQNGPVVEGMAGGPVRPPAAQTGDGVMVESPPSQPLQNQPNQPKPSRPAPGGGRVIRSPFGDIIRPE